MNLKSEDFNWKRVPLGRIGRTQKRILDVLEEVPFPRVGIKTLTPLVYELELDQHHNYTKSQYRTVHQSVQRLERRGLVRTEMVPVRRYGRTYHMKSVGLPKTKKEKK